MSWQRHGKNTTFSTTFLCFFGRYLGCRSGEPELTVTFCTSVVFSVHACISTLLRLFFST